MKVPLLLPRVCIAFALLIGVLHEFLLLVPVVNADTDVAEISSTLPAPSALLGGLSIPSLSKSQVAFIDAGQYSCTGVLVGSREILTAAHCVDPALTTADFAIYVGGKRYGISDGYYDSSFDNVAAPSIQGSKHDLGLLLLASPVTNIVPFPVAVDYPPYFGLLLSVFGYGISELSPSSFSSPLEEGKGGDVAISTLSSGTFLSTHESTGVSVCIGDSGGPALLGSFGNYAVVGITSLTANKSSRGVCSLASDGSSVFVDLQSPEAKNFLSAFRGIQFIPGRIVQLRSQAAELRKGVSSGLAAKKTDNIRKNLRRLANRFNILFADSDPSRDALIIETKTLLKRASNGKSRKDVLRIGRKAIAKIDALIAF